jgi:hypothetical protein
MVLFFFSDDGEGLVCLVVAVMVVYISTIVYILLVLCCLYAYQLCIVMFMNTSNVCLQTYIVKKSMTISLSTWRPTFIETKLGARRTY